MILYGIPNCNTVKKAQNFLTSAGISFEFHDFKKKGISRDKLQYWCDRFGWENVLNKKGLTFKKLSPAEQKDMDSYEKAVNYLMNNTSAIKRPILENGSELTGPGFDEKVYQKLKI